MIRMGFFRRVVQVGSSSSDMDLAAIVTIVRIESSPSLALHHQQHQACGFFQEAVKLGHHFVHEAEYHAFTFFTFSTKLC